MRQEVTSVMVDPPGRPFEASQGPRFAGDLGCCACHGPHGNSTSTLSSARVWRILCSHHECILSPHQTFHERSLSYFSTFQTMFQSAREPDKVTHEHAAEDPCNPCRFCFPAMYILGQAHADAFVCRSEAACQLSRLCWFCFHHRHCSRQ